MNKKNDKHYVDNEEFHSLLCENKKIIETYFYNNVKDLDFSVGIEKMMFKKQMNLFDIKTIKDKINLEEIILNTEEKKEFDKLRLKIKSIIKLEKKIKTKCYFMDNDDIKKERNNIIIKLEKYRGKYVKFLQSVHIKNDVKNDIRILKEKELDRLRKNEIIKRKNKKYISLIIKDNVFTQNKQYIRVQNKIGRIFIRICQGILTKPNFINYTWDRKDDMISEATFHMTRYVLLFDTKLTHPFSYFTTVCSMAFLQSINKQNKYSDKFQPLVYIENFHLKNNTMLNEDN